MTRVLFSVVIPTCQRPGELRACLTRLTPGVQTLSPDAYEVIVTDDGETAAEPVLGAEFPWVRWTRGPRRGPAANRNHGASLARGAWLAFVDDDCLPATGWLAAYAGAIAGPARVLEGPTLAIGRRSSVDAEAPVNATGGFLWSCNFAIERVLFTQLGGFDETFAAATMEDVELATRLAKRSCDHAFVPAAVVHHPWRRSKGRAHLQAYARSVRRFVDLHPEQAARFSLRVSLRTLLSILVRQGWEAVRLHRGRGFLRLAGLETYRFFAVRAALRTFPR